MIQFKCPGCGKAFRVDDSAAGKHAKCQACGRRIQVPAGLGPQTQAPPALPSARAALPSSARNVYPDDAERIAAEALGKADNSPVGFVRTQPVPAGTPPSPVSAKQADPSPTDQQDSPRMSGTSNVASFRHSAGDTYVPREKTNSTPYIVCGVVFGVVALVGIALFASGILQIGRPKIERIAPSVASEKDAVSKGIRDAPSVPVAEQKQPPAPVPEQNQSPVPVAEQSQPPVPVVEQKQPVSGSRQQVADLPKDVAYSTSSLATNESSAPDKGAIAKFLTAYQKTPFADRGKYVLDPEESEKARETYYKDQPMADEIQTVVSSVKAGPKADYLTVVARYSYTSAGRTTSVMCNDYLAVTKNGLKVDWAANVGYNAVGIKAWAAGTDRTFTLRVKAKLSDIYSDSDQYRQAKETHYSVYLQDNYFYDVLHGYVPKDSDLGKKFFEILKDGQEHQLIVTVERTGSESSSVGIKQLVSETWVK